MSKEKLEIDLGKLYLIVGLPASGKSSFLKKNNISSEMILSSDEIRKDFIGESRTFRNGKVVHIPNQSSNNLVFEIITKILRERMKNNLTTFLDAASNVEYKYASNFRNIAAEYGVETEILYMDESLENSLYYDSNRKYSVGENVIRNFHEDYNNFLKFEEEYKTNPKNGFKPFKKHIININTKISLKPNLLPHEKYDIIGDTHGQYDTFIKMIENIGYIKDSNGIYKHPKGRNLLLLGDFLDRGEQSLDMLKFVYKQTKNTNDKAILGNHENKLINFINFKEKDDKVVRMSTSAATTASDFLKLPENEQKKYFKMLKSLPKYYIHNNIVFAHAHLNYFDPSTTTGSEMMYGQEHSLTKDGDTVYSRLFEEGENNFYLVRGHIRATNEKQKHVLSLERGSAFNGNLAGVKLEDLEDSIAQGKGVNNDEILFLQKVNFDYGKYQKEKFDLFFKVRRLLKEKFINEQKSKDGLLSIYKYKKEVFFKKLWKVEPDLMSCRGIVFDFAGNLVQYPFDKVYNYGEPNEKDIPTGKDFDLNKEYIAVEKLNGFFGAITKDPFKDDLLMTTTGHFFSDFNQYIKDMVIKNNHYGNLRKLTAKTPDVTYMFEVIHPDDPHIVDYSDEEKDIYLIGARKKEFGSKLYTESELDSIAEEYGLKRPQWKIDKLSNILKESEKTKTEGYMLRDKKNNKTLAKIKSNHYLVVKFLSRLSDKKAKHMFGNPKDFKKHSEEENYPLIDKITTNLTYEEFANMDQEKRKILVNDYIDQLRAENQTTSKKLKNKKAP
tara:strand:- start:28103 stop:30442 length:2340 start_codon:yes stop_codon:yes gene_type:complete